MLLGLYPSILETDNRIALPEGIQEDYKDGLYITQGFDRNIMVLTMDAFEMIYDRITSLNISDPIARLLLRMILGTARMTALDNQGKIPIPEELKQFANLERDVILVGQGEYVELWSPDAWMMQKEQLSHVEPDRFSALHISTQ